MKTGLLIAEADSELRDLANQIASRWGFDVETAGDGLECWSKLRGGDPAALIVDADMPWGGADGVVARLREERTPRKSPAVFVTGNEHPEQLSRRFGVPASYCFQKPFRWNSLLGLISTDARSRFPPR